MVLTVGQSTSRGAWVVLDDGSAGEVAASVQFLDEGQQSLVWTLESDNGLITGASSGNISVFVQPQQSVAVDIIDVESTADDGIKFSVVLTLDAGVARTVKLQLGYETGGATVYLQENNVELQQGAHTFDFTFGEVTAERLVAQIAPVNWLIGPGPLTATASLPDDATQFWLEFSSTTDPIRPVVGDEVRVELTLRQSGPLLDERGDLWVIDAYGTQLAKVTSPSWNGAEETTVSVSITWPKGSNVGLRAMWQVNGDLVVAETTYVSGDVVVETSTEWPIAAIVWGVALGGALVLVLRLQSRRKELATTSSTSSSSTKPSTAPLASEEKRQVSCPACDRRLRVPVSYAGTIGCPDCGHKFAVEASTTPPPASSKPAEEEDEVEVVEEAPETSPEKVEVGCPACSQTLRIPRSYQGSVRCPACTNIFKAQDVVSQ